MEKSRLEWAQWMAAKGINVFAVTPNEKRPLEGPSWYLRQSTEPETIAQFFDQTPNCNYGLHLGAEYVVIDLDLKPGHNGVKAFEEICRENGIDDFTLEIDTLMARTPGGGYHLYFKSPFPCANKNNFPDGIDVRGVTGYVVGSGSVDSRGEWALIDPSAEITPLPEWLEPYVVQPGYKDPNRDKPLIEWDLEENVEHAREWLKSREPAVEGANGDDWTYETCQYLRDFGVSEAKALDVLSEWNKRCEPPWDKEELEAKISNAYEYGQNRPGCKAPTYKAQRIVLGHGGWSDYITAHFPRLAVDNTAPAVDDDVPGDGEPDLTRRQQIERELEQYIGKRSGRTFELLDEHAQDKLREPEWLVEGLLPTVAVGQLFGPQDSFKSFVMLDLCLHIAAGMEYGARGKAVSEVTDDGETVTARPVGARSVKQGPVVYCAGEGETGIGKKRRPAWRRHHGIDPVRKLPFTLLRPMPHFSSLSDIAGLVEMIEGLDVAPRLIVLDTLSRAMLGMEENGGSDAGVAIGLCEYLKDRFGCLVLFVHHTGHNDTDRGRGHSVLRGNTDLHIRVTAKGMRAYLEVHKQKDDAKVDGMLCYDMVEVAVGNSTSLVPVPSFATDKELSDTKNAKERAESWTDHFYSKVVETLEETQGTHYSQATLAWAALPLAYGPAKMAEFSRIEDQGRQDKERVRAKERVRNTIRKDAFMDRLVLAGHAMRDGTSKTASWIIGWQIAPPENNQENS